MSIIDIIIPCYKAKKTLPKLLNSLAAQIGIEKCQITLSVDDDESYQQIIEKFDCLKIQEIKTVSRKGPGAARQLGIDNTNGEFVMFCDADDILYDNLVLNKLFEKMLDPKIRVVYGKILEIRNNKYSQIESNHGTWVLGALYRREFLKKNNIKFESTYFGEDCGFNRKILILSKIGEVFFLDEFTYIWTDSNSTERLTNGKNLIVDSNKGYVENIINVIKFCENQNLPYSKIQLEVVEFIVALTSKFLTIQNLYPEDADKFILWCKKFYKKVFKYASTIEKNMILHSLSFKSKITLYDVLNFIDKIKK